MSENNKKYFMNSQVARLVNKYKENSGVGLTEIAKRAGISQSHFSRMINQQSTEPKAMGDEHALKILLACNYTMDDAKYHIAQIKVMEAFSALTDSQKQELVNSIDIKGDIISGDGNNVNKPTNITINNG